MRHDDTILTAVALAKKDAPDARAAAFRQLIDLSIQRRSFENPHLNRQALRALTMLARKAPQEIRSSLIDKVGREGATALHLRLFRHELSHHYDRLLQLARLDEAEWWRFARRAPAHVLSNLLTRRDLPGPVREMLLSSSSGITRLFANGEAADRPQHAPGRQPAATPMLEASQSQVRQLIDRIAAFRARGETNLPAAAPSGSPPLTALRPEDDGALTPRWTWQCDENAVFISSPDVPPALVGHWLTEAETPESPGKIARAFERRAAFRDCAAVLRFGDRESRWRLSGVPQFDRKSGRFTGYWGSSVEIDSAAPSEVSPRGLFGTGASGEALATMAHEVRTPLNAIIGFAQLIENEILGEAGEEYKQTAGTILKHAEQLLGAFDDLSDAARIEQGRFRTGSGPFDAAAAANAVVARYSTLASERQVSLVSYIASGIPPVDADVSVFDRMLARLLTAAIGTASAGEAIFVIVQPAAGGKLRIAVSRPRSTVGISEEALLNPLPRQGDVGAAILGIGFGLKLVASLAGTIDAKFEVTDFAFELTMPAAPESRESAVS